MFRWPGSPLPFKVHHTLPWLLCYLSLSGHTLYSVRERWPHPYCSPPSDSCVSKYKLPASHSTCTSLPQFNKRNQLMAFLDKWKWLNFQEVKNQSVQGLNSGNEKLAMTYFPPKSEIFFKVFIYGSWYNPEFTVIQVYTNVLINFGLLPESWEGGVSCCREHTRVYRELGWQW